VTLPLRANLGADGKLERTVRIPSDAHRLVGLTVVLEDGEARFAHYLGAVAVVPPRRLKGYRPDGPFISSIGINIRKGKPHAREAPFGADALAEGYKRMGIDWVRLATHWGVWEPKEGEVDWSGVDALYDLFRRHGILVMHLVGPVPRWAQAQGEALVDVPYKNFTIKSDWAPAKSHLDRFGEAHREFYTRTKDVVRAANVWNEPWEGMGITGWKSTGDHYRAIVREIRDAVEAVDPSIKIVAADSAHNTDWKLFAAGMEDAIDAISTHYSRPDTSPAFAMKRHYGKELWETETWKAWQGDAACVRHALLYFANGGDKVSLWNGRMLFDQHGRPEPSVVWTAATRHLLDGLTFRKVVHPERPPFVLLFSGEKRHVAAVCTTLVAETGERSGAFRQQFIGDAATMMLPEGGYAFYDLLANPLTPQRRDGKLLLPVNVEPRYIEFRGPAEQFEERLAAADYRGLRPVNIVVHDLTQRLGQKPALRLELQNAYNTRLEATVRVETERLTLEPDTQKVTLSPAGKKTVEFTIASAAEDGANAFPLRVVAETERGTAELRDTVHESIIAQGTPIVDGDVSEWQGLGTRPVLMSESGAPSEALARAWFPWRELAESGGEFTAQLAFAHDDKNLYLMARVKDPSRDALPPMLAGKNLHQLQNPPGDHMYVQAGPIPGASGDLIQLALAGLNRDPFVPKYEIRPPDHPLHRMGAFLRANFIYMLYPTDDGGAELMRVRTPDFYYLHPLPIDYAWLAEHCKVPGARVTVRRRQQGYVYEAAIPWSELKGLPHADGARLRMNVLVQNGGMGSQLQWSAGRSAARHNTLDFEPGWGSGWSNDTQWGIVGR
jgi:hypothetical protein